MLDVVDDHIEVSISVESRFRRHSNPRLALVVSPVLLHGSDPRLHDVAYLFELALSNDASGCVDLLHASKQPADLALDPLRHVGFPFLS